MTAKNEVAENRRALIETIRECDMELMDFKRQAKDVDEQLADCVGGFEETKEVKRLRAELEAAQKRQAAVLSGDQEFNNLMDQKASINLGIKDTKEVLSTHVVAWHELTGENQVEYDEIMGKEVIVTGRLGKLERYQTNIFTPKDKLEKMDLTITANGMEVKTNTEELANVAKIIKKRGTNL